MSSELIELKKISKILLLTNAKILEAELSKYATSEERKKIWILINGNRTVNDLIQAGGMKQRAVYDYLKILEIAELIDFPHGKAPKKILDFVPASWLNLVKVEEVNVEKKQSDNANLNSNTEKNPGDLGKWVK